MPRSVLGRSFVAVLATLASTLLACALAAPALAAPETYGELGTRFGGSGVGNGQFELTSATAAFGVDPEDGGVYVGDEPAEEAKGAKYPVGDYRLQKLGEKGEFLGAAAFKAKCPKGEGKPCAQEEGEQGIEGIAFDTVKNEKGELERRLYVLSTFERGESQKYDSETIVAGVLYAYSTKPKEEGGEKKLVPAAGTGPEGVLTTLEGLKGNSKEKAASLLEPKGIAVDPSTHEIIIAGDVDEGGTGIASDEGLHLALQRINAKGELGARYVSPVREYGFVAPNSPVVTQSGQVLMQQNEEIVQIPSNFTSTKAPNPVYQLDPNEEIIEFGEPPGEERGGALAIAPESGDKGTLYADASLDPSLGNSSSGQGLLALHYESKEHEEEAHVSEFGWIAGTSAASESQKCVIGFEGVLEEPIVAADAHKAFVLEPGFGGAIAEPRVDEFGPNEHPEGCPLAKATEPVGTVEGAKVTRVKVGKEVTFSSTVEGANALSVEWTFGKEAPVIVSSDENQETEVVHAFKEAGPLKVTEKITSDDLSTPVIEVSTSIEVLPSGSCPESPVVEEQPKSVTVTEPATAAFKATASTPSGCEPPKVQWYSQAPGAGSFSPIAGATSTSYTTPATATADSGTEYKAKFTNAHGPAESSAATLTVNPEPPCSASPVAEEQPKSAVVTEPATATFKATASTPQYCGAPEVQWYSQAPGAGSFSPIAGATSTSYTTPATATADSGTEYKAKFTNAHGPAESSAATLTVNPAPPCSASPSIGVQPGSQAVQAPAVATFNATASTPEHCEAPKVQWYSQAPGAGSFSPIAGATATSYTTPATTAADSGTQYKAVFTNAHGATESSAATLSVSPEPIGEVKGFGVEHNPEAKLASTSIVVSASGAFTLKVTCPAKEESCTGTVVLRTANAVSASARKHKAAVLTLASGPFVVAGGQVKSITLHLSAKARALLGRTHVVRAKATIAAADPAGVKRTTLTIVTLRAAKAKRKR